MLLPWETMPEDMTPEDELCLLLARRQLAPEGEQKARQLLTHPLRWGSTLERARTHDVLPLVCHHLRALGLPGVPAAVASQLNQAFRINQLRNALLADELVRLLRLLETAGVPVIPLKGLTLAEPLYGNAALRVSFDIDLLVPRQDAVRTRRLLLTHGYASPVKEQFFVNYQLHTLTACSLLAGQGVPCPLDLRWGLLTHSSKDREATEELWAEARETTVLGVRARTLSPEWEFLFLALHAATHGWQMLKWLVDIHEVCATRSIDWQSVKEKADRLELDHAVERTFRACEQLLGTPVPRLFVPRALPAGVSLFPAAPFHAGTWQVGRFQLYMLKRLADRLRWLAAAAFVPTEIECELLSLPPWLGFLYYGLRPLRLACKWTWLLLRAGWGRLPQPLRSPDMGLEQQRHRHE